MTKTVKVTASKIKDARLLAEIVGKANEFSSRIIFIMDSKSINAKSIMGVMGLGIDCGSQLTIEATGDDQEAAIEAILDFLKEK